MSPTFLNTNGYRFSIFSNEEKRIHIHVYKAENDAKYWLEPVIELDYNHGFSTKELKEIFLIVKQNESEFKQKYKEHIG
jgi:hypothetical protein